MKHKSFILVLLMVMELCAASCSEQVPGTSDAAKDETMFQTATLQSLMIGNYDGFISVGELRSYGNHGLGTFEGVDGEMIILGDTVFQAKVDGSVAVAADDVMVPFACATHFDTDFCSTVEGIRSLDGLLDSLEKIVRANGQNFIYAVKIEVDDCDSVRVRSVAPQQKPYKPLAEVVKTDQREYVYQHVGGTIVGVYFPAYMAQLNAAGWHCHFLSNDRSKGGHLLDIAFAAPVTVQLDLTPAFMLNMPDEKSFADADLDSDLSADIEAVEK